MALGMSGIAPAHASTSPVWSLVRSKDLLVPRDGLAGVSCLAARPCVGVGQAVGRAGGAVPLIKHWNGHAWPPAATQ